MIITPPPTYAGQIQPLLQRRCMPCHDAATRTSGLALDSYAAVMRGGKGGAVVVAGHSSESRLITRVEGRAAPRMPPAGAGLTAAEIAALRAWIDAGAKEDRPAAARTRTEAQTPNTGHLTVIQLTAPVHGPVNAVAFSPDGRWLAVGGYRRAWLVDVSGETRRAGGAGTRGLLPPRVLGGRRQPPRSSRLATSLERGSLLPSVFDLAGLAAGPITSLAFNPDGRMLAAAGGAPGQSGEVRLWDVRTRRLVRMLRGHRDAIYGIAFSPDGRTLAAASYDRLVSLWSVPGGAPRMLKDHIDAVYAVAFTPDGRQVASAAGDRTIKVWEVATGRRVYTLSEPLAEQYTVAFSRDGRHLAAAGADKIVRVWDVTPAGGKLAHTAFAHDGAVLSVLFSRDGRRLYTTGDDRRVKVWDATSLTEQRVLERQPDWAPALALDPAGRRLAVGRFDGSVALYGSADGRRLQSLTLRSLQP